MNSLWTKPLIFNHFLSYEQNWKQVVKVLPQQPWRIKRVYEPDEGHLNQIFNSFQLKDQVTLGPRIQNYYPLHGWPKCACRMHGWTLQHRTSPPLPPDYCPFAIVLMDSTFLFPCSLHHPLFVVVSTSLPRHPQTAPTHQFSPSLSRANSLAICSASCTQSVFLPVAWADMSLPPPLPSSRGQSSWTHSLAFRPRLATFWGGREKTDGGEGYCDMHSMPGHKAIVQLALCDFFLCDCSSQYFHRP